LSPPLPKTEYCQVSVEGSVGVNLQTSALYDPWHMFVSVYVEPLARRLLGPTIPDLLKDYQVVILGKCRQTEREVRILPARRQGGPKIPRPTSSSGAAARPGL
jgi:hypothetical protein